MFPGDVIFKKTCLDNKDDGDEYAQNREGVQQKGDTCHPPPTVLLLRGFGICRLEISDHGDEGGGKRKNDKEMPYVSGQKMFANVFHTLDINFGSEPLMRCWDHPYTWKDI